MKRLVTFSTILLVYFALTACTTNNIVSLGYFDNYLIVGNDENKTDEKWADYLYNHLCNHTPVNKFIYRSFAIKDKCITISVHVDSSLDCDYKIERERESIRLSANNEDNMLWLIYQFIAAAAEEDERFVNNDIPPAIIKLDNCQGTMAFEYRAIYSPTNSNEEMLPIRATHHIDYNWGIWGHNIKKIVADYDKDDIYAVQNGKMTKEQYCFSSPSLYNILDNYINDQFGKSGERITIMPNDNMIACTCSRCKAMGNTDKNATPAVAALLARLARKYPKHQFFMTAYNTNLEPPAKALPDNVGVMLSTFDIPMQCNFRNSKGLHTFQKRLDAWKSVAKLMYVWEYSQNFDDYLTPYPCLYILQERFRYYKEQGIKGISINGSGDDFSTFDELHTYILSALLIDPDISVEDLTNKFCKQHYPLCYNMIAEYCLSLENKVKNENRELPYYGTMQDNIDSYLNAEEFETFWTTLDKESKKADTDERKQLSYMLTAMCYSRLELLKHKKIEAEKKADIIDILKNYKSVPHLLNYKETNGSLEEYLKKNK